MNMLVRSFLRFFFSRTYFSYSILHYRALMIFIRCDNAASIVTPILTLSECSDEDATKNRESPARFHKISRIFYINVVVDLTVHPLGHLDSYSLGRNSYSLDRSIAGRARARTRRISLGERVCRRRSDCILYYPDPVRRFAMLCYRIASHSHTRYHISRA